MNASADEKDARIDTHAVVTPAWNEAENLRRLGECLASQTWLPEAWIVVDNGSTDGTADVVRDLGRVHSWIRLVSIDGDATARRGRASVRAFNAGVTEDLISADLITSLDADVSFGSTYFSRLRQEFETEPRLGIAAGVCHELRAEQWEPVHVTRPNLRGAALTFRNACLRQLLPLEGRFSWDGIATVRASIRGWETSSIRDLPYFHHRSTGARDVNRFSSFVEDGDAAYYMWYRPSYMLGRTLYRILSRREPAAVGLAWGYARSALRRKPRHEESGFRDFVHSSQSLRNWQLRANEVLGRR